ncbi:MAG: NAD(P)(+) transhydrogenase (Re/Si-specific) subunit beta [candidate division KSB1 bacterium]|nr:NAD(P)(+) transhydrogenase (Re/Si-specific) subunit beta [candidate division KSB1 bacterium]
MPKEEALIKLFYLAAAVLFIIGLKRLSHPRTAVRGNLLAALGMLLAIVVTLTDKRIVSFQIIVAGFVTGGLLGVIMAYKAPMTAMPQVVAIFNGFGGGASALAVGAALEEALRGEWIEEITVQFTSSATAAAFIGAVSLTGSLIAFGKLQGLIKERPILLPGRHAMNIALLLLCLGLSAWQVVGYSPLQFSAPIPFAAELDRATFAENFRQTFAAHGISLSNHVTIASEGKNEWRITDRLKKISYEVERVGDRVNVYTRSALPFWLMVVVACVLGIMLVIPIGGADMPVVISLLNAYSGIAAAGHGWVLNNSVLIVAGSLVGAAGFILTALMSKAMNRSLTNIMFAGVGAVVASEAESEDLYAGKVKSASPEEVAMLLESARRVVITPGYGLAVAQAQYAIQDLTSLLESKGIEVEFAIHPVAGRMPGHMNVLLAEANIPYEKLKEMDEINPTFRQTDVVLVIGANDVVNPLARHADPSIPIAGMPILNVDQARSVIIIKRSLSPGFAGIANPLFVAANALMLFGDAKQMTMDLVSAFKQA